jgi:RecT family
MSTNDKAIVKFNPETGFVFDDIDGMFRAAECYLQSGFAPRGFNTPQQLVICWARAAELGVRPLQAMEGMQVINNRLGIGGDMGLALVRSKGMLMQSPKVAYTGEGDSLTCTVELHRKGDDEPRTYLFSVKQAKQAKIYERSDPWKSYPERMTYYRALGFGLRDLFGDVLKGMVTSEELHDYPDVLEADEAKIERNRAAEQKIKAREPESFVETTPGPPMPTPAQAVEPAFPEDKRPDMPPFAEKLQKDFPDRIPPKVTAPPPEPAKPVTEPPDELDMSPPPVQQQEPLPEPPWKSHVITGLRHVKYYRKQIGALTQPELAVLEEQWIPAVRKKWAEASEEQKQDVTMLEACIAYHKMEKPW